MMMKIKCCCMLYTVNCVHVLPLPSTYANARMLPEVECLYSLIQRHCQWQIA